MSDMLRPDAPRVDWWCFAFTEVAGDLGELDAEERRRYDAFYFDRDRAAYLASHLGLRRILADSLGCPPAEVAIVRPVERGKPMLCPIRHPAGPDFNLSHCKSHAAVAVGTGARVGIDIEIAREMDDIDGLLEMVASPQELAAFAALPDALRLPAFWRLWTVKEAVLKGLGVGFGQDPRSVEVDPDPRRPLRRLGDTPWRLWSLDLGPGLAATLAVEADTTPRRCRLSDLVHGT